MNYINRIQIYFSLVKFSHTIFALPFALIGFSLGYTEAFHDNFWQLLLLVILCMVFARNTAMSFNRYIDRAYDKLNKRTAQREIPAHLIKPNHALIFVVINASLFILTTFFINKMSFFLSPIALFVILIYSYTKRFTYLSHFVLGLSLSIAPIAAYIAVTNSFAVLPLIISLIVLFWVGGFDILYAIQDELFDREHHLKSIPVLLGAKKAHITSVLCHFITAFIVVFAGINYQMSYVYWIGALFFLCLLMYQHLLFFVYGLKKINLVFFTINGVASIFYAVFFILEVLIKHEINMFVFS